MESFCCIKNSSSAIILLRVVRNAFSPPLLANFSSPSMIVISILAKGRFQNDRWRFTISANGCIIFVSPWMTGKYLSLKFSWANFRIDSSIIWERNRNIFLKYKLTTVEPPLERQGKCPLNRGDPLTEVNKIQRLYWNVNFAGTKVGVPSSGLVPRKVFHWTKMTTYSNRLYWY